MGEPGATVGPNTSIRRSTLDSATPGLLGTRGKAASISQAVQPSIQQTGSEHSTHANWERAQVPLPEVMPGFGLLAVIKEAQQPRADESKSSAPPPFKAKPPKPPGSKKGAGGLPSRQSVSSTTVSSASRPSPPKPGRTPSPIRGLEQSLLKRSNSRDLSSDMKPKGRDENKQQGIVASSDSLKEITSEETEARAQEKRALDRFKDEAEGLLIQYLGRGLYHPKDGKGNAVEPYFEGLKDITFLVTAMGLQQALAACEKLLGGEKASIESQREALQMRLDHLRDLAQSLTYFVTKYRERDETLSSWAQKIFTPGFVEFENKRKELAKREQLSDEDWVAQKAQYSKVIQDVAPELYSAISKK